MADTRCANPEYQLDVDIMMIEFLVYRAIEATLEFLKLQLAGTNDSSSSDHLLARVRQKRTESTSLYKNVEILLTLYLKKHSLAQLSVGGRYNLKILDFLILLSHWIQYTEFHLDLVVDNDGTEHSQSPADAPVVLRQVEKERAINSLLRHNWLISRFYDSISDTSKLNLSARKRKRPGQSDSDWIFSEGLNEFGYGDPLRWDPLTVMYRRQYRREPPNDKDVTLGWYIAGSSVEGSTNFLPTLAELIPRFMDLSVDLTRAMGDVNELWTKLAVELMYHSALERLTFISDDSDYDLKGTFPEKLACYRAYRGWIEECFAWGSWSMASTNSVEQLKSRLKHSNHKWTGDELHDRLRREALACAMFTSSIDMRQEDHDIVEALGDSDMGGDRPNWTEARKDSRHKLMECDSYDCWPFCLRYDELQEDVPLQSFLTSLLQFIEGALSCNASKDVSGKPILIQIEDGGIDGLDTEEFKQFLERTGLKMSRKVDQNGRVSSHVRWSVSRDAP